MMISSMVPIIIGRHVVVDANDDCHRQHQHQHHRDRHVDIEVDVDDDRWLLAIRGGRVVLRVTSPHDRRVLSKARADDLSSLRFYSPRQRAPSKKQRLLRRGLSHQQGASSRSFACSRY